MASNSHRGTVDPVDLDERETAVRTSPFRLFAEVECRTGSSIEGLFVLAGGTVVFEFEAHMGPLAPR